MNLISLFIRRSDLDKINIVQILLRGTQIVHRFKSDQIILKIFNLCLQKALNFEDQDSHLKFYRIGIPNRNFDV